MNVSDPIADMLTRIRNANAIGRKQASMPASRLKVGIAEVLKEEGFIDGFSVEPAQPVSVLHVQLRYGPDGEQVIRSIERVSKPGRRVYMNATDIRPVLRGLGSYVLSTNKGVVSDRTARKIPMHLVLDTTENMIIRERETFGPLLMVLTYSELEEGIDYVNARDRALAIYPFTPDRERATLYIERIMSGGVTVNDALLHVAQHDLPFGGVGASAIEQSAAADRNQVARSFAPILSRIIRVALWAVVMVVALDAAGVQVGALVAGYRVAMTPVTLVVDGQVQAAPHEPSPLKRRTRAAWATEVSPNPSGSPAAVNGFCQVSERLLSVKKEPK